MRSVMLAAVTVVASTLFALIIGELFLTVYSGRQTADETMDPGLVRYHSRYGWTLTPGWEGRHRHAEYDVTYHIDRLGFRQQPHDPDPASPLTLVVGDSFTFGLGVEDDAPWVARLGIELPAERFINAAVPGYSPEQALLKAEDLFRAYAPARILFVIYLGNDLVDIGLPFAVQADYPKPYAELQDGHWQLANLPVPRDLARPAALQSRSLSSYIVEPGSQGWFAGLKLGQLVLENGLLPNPARIDGHRVEQKIALTDGILARLGELDAARTTLLLLPGSGPVNRPGSLTADYQQQVAQRIAALADERGIACLSLVASLVAAGPDLYYPLDGHLTAGGHRAVAEIVRQQLFRHQHQGDQP